MIVAGTGHRPDKLGGYGKEVAFKLHNLAFDWFEFNRESIDMVISGGALGWDQAIAAAAREQELPYIMALPFPGFEDRWPKQSKQTLYALMHAAEKTVFICEAGYAGWKMQKRNEWMVDKADIILALWDGSSGGTANCLNYAQKRKPIVNLWDKYK